VRLPDLPKASQRFLCALFFAGLSCSPAQGQFVRDAKSECEQLLNATLPLAKQMLQEHGEFFPFARALNAKGQVVAVAAHDESYPTSEDLIRQLRQTFVAQATAGEYRATALVYDARVRAPAKGVKTDAIAVALDHRDNYSVVVFLPYRLEGGKLTLGEMFAQRGSGEVFEHR
jgi:hypothetical protein